MVTDLSNNGKCFKRQVLKSIRICIQNWENPPNSGLDIQESILFSSSKKKFRGRKLLNILQLDNVSERTPVTLSASSSWSQGDLPNCGHDICIHGVCGEGDVSVILSFLLGKRRFFSTKSPQVSFPHASLDRTTSCNCPRWKGFWERKKQPCHLGFDCLK